MEGQYQNYITDLPNLEAYRYENLFKVYQTPNSTTPTGEPAPNFYYYNILKNISVPDNIASNIFDVIVLPTSLPLSVLSYQLYGTTYLWWLICIVNKITNPFQQISAGTKIKVIQKPYVKPILDSIKQQLQWDIQRHFLTPHKITISFSI